MLQENSEIITFIPGRKSERFPVAFPINSAERSSHLVLFIHHRPTNRSKKRRRRTGPVGSPRQNSCRSDGASSLLQSLFLCLPSPTVELFQFRQTWQRTPTRVNLYQWECDWVGWYSRSPTSFDGRSRRRRRTDILYICWSEQNVPPRKDKQAKAGQGKEFTESELRRFHCSCGSLTK